MLLNVRLFLSSEYVISVFVSNGAIVYLVGVDFLHLFVVSKLFITVAMTIEYICIMHDT